MTITDYKLIAQQNFTTVLANLSTGSFMFDNYSWLSSSTPATHELSIITSERTDVFHEIANTVLTIGADIGADSSGQLSVVDKVLNNFSNNNNNISDNFIDVNKEIYKNSILFIVSTSIVLTILTICTVIGNILVIAAVLLERNLRTPANYLVLSLAVADFLVACLVMPLGAFYEIQGQWTLGDILCEFWTSVDVLCCSASILHLLAIAMDRYWAVTNVDYMHHRNAKRICLMILTIWLVAAVIAMAPNFGWKDSDYKNRIQMEKRCLVSQDVGYQLFATVATFYAPLILILLLYWKIYKVARRRIRRKPGSKIEIKTSQLDQVMDTNSSPNKPLSPTVIQTISPNVDRNCHEMNHMNTKLTVKSKPTIGPPSMSITDRSTSTTCASNTTTMTNHSPPLIIKPLLLRSKSTLKQTLNSKREKKAAKTLAIVTGVFVICWAPFFILALALPLCPTCNPPLLLMSVFLWLGYVNSLLNCIIYTIFSPDFRTAFKKLLCGRQHRYRHSFR
ncbi:5-hydroxytryptamine receptor-like [Oppia nitens]|uniref:5-hydroxytryptamine receptor-like n=1 Tax=Oppia nitens TaxID=1686743 RepID=UPI0023DBC02C|nr:5-hydroxytryptamine receptor-like [Oppia nitens]